METQTLVIVFLSLGLIISWILTSLPPKYERGKIVAKNVKTSRSVDDEYFIFAHDGKNKVTKMYVERNVYDTFNIGDYITFV